MSRLRLVRSAPVSSNSKLIFSANRRARATCKTSPPACGKSPCPMPLMKKLMRLSVLRPEAVALLEKVVDDVLDDFG